MSQDRFYFTALGNEYSVGILRSGRWSSKIAPSSDVVKHVDGKIEKIDIMLATHLWIYAFGIYENRFERAIEDAIL